MGSLETFLRTEIGIDEGAVQAYLSDGRRLRTENVRDLDSVQDQVCPCTPHLAYDIPPKAFPYTFVFQALTFIQTIFVFNKYYVHKDIDEAVKLLHLQPPLQLPIHGMHLMLRAEDMRNI